MVLKSLKMFNFRRFGTKYIGFSDSLNILMGKNATGKTSVLEGIYYLALTKSFKTSDDLSVIKENESEMSIIGEVCKSESCDSYKIIKTAKGKAIARNDYKFKKISDYLGEILVVAFTNFDIINLVGSPKDRRKIIEPIICQISKFYTDECNCYKKLLNDRNTLLKRLTFEKKESLTNVLKVIDLQLVASAQKIISFRKKFIDKVNLKLNDFYKKIAGAKEDLKIEYLPSATPDEMGNKLANALLKDLKKGTTSVGPHRDDYVFIINNKNITLYGSQGQQRSALIATKLTFLDLLKEDKKENPILLLDDVLSELDRSRQNNLFEAIDGNIQTFVSTSTISELDKKIIDKAKIINLEEEM